MQCGIENKDEKLVLSILSKLGSKFSVFVSNFHYGRLITLNWQMTSLDSFTESVIQEQDKLIQMGALKASPNQSLLAGETSIAQSRRKHKGKEKRNTEFEPKYEFDSSDEASGSRKDIHQRYYKGKFSYCKNGNHT